ncbi:uncharacterized protein DFL_003142 [Arthrobotrys flagrans]|uniref:Uncharacterized protein n=1 Tax=Arthrobotrys flagrans TaxID=97331 RepID=A0A437A7K7_ARTFL|nr:hypothetical protein DFL_003142 [Arthrobotrys flagrans]
MSLMGGASVRTIEYINDYDFSDQLTVLKSCLLVFKYLREPTVQANFEAQVRRMGTGLNFLELGYIPSVTLGYEPGRFKLARSWYKYPAIRRKSAGYQQ